jgi:hypothetical protein
MSDTTENDKNIHYIVGPYEPGPPSGPPGPSDMYWLPTFFEIASERGCHSLTHTDDIT